MTGSEGTSKGLHARSVTLRLGRRLLFRDFDLSLMPGELVHLVGENGAGKTTLLKVLAGLRTPDSGDVLYNGEPIADAGADYRADLVFLGHVNGVKAELTPRENLQVHAALSGRDAASVEDAIDLLDLRAVVDQPCRLLSSGQRQRVALARLELLDGQLWLLDEPFTALDVQGRSHIASLMRAHAANGGSVLFTSHQALDAEALRTLNLASPAGAQWSGGQQ